MKKVIFTTIFAIATFSGITSYQLFENRESVNALSLANIEALSEPENGYKYVYYVDYGDHTGCNCWGAGYEHCCGIR